jgi:branched-chain amino acid transport system permease protein
MAAERARAALREAALAAVVAFLLAVPLVGFETVDFGRNGTGIATRFGWVWIGVGTVFAGRLALSALGAARVRRTKVGPADSPARLGAPPRHARALLGAALLAGAVALPFLPFSSRYLVDLATTVLIYIMLGWGLNVVVGLAGLLDLGYVAFYAVGAYSFALFARWFGLSFWEALPVSGLLAASFGIVLGFPVLRLRGDYLAIVTLGFGEMIRIILLNWSPVTGGPNGLIGIPRPTFFGLPLVPHAPGGGMTFHQFFGIPFNSIQRIDFLYFVILALALVTNGFTLRLRHLPIGRAWEALREDEIACRALGIDPTKVKLSAFAIGAMLGGFAGAFFATRLGFISPESFTFQESATILAIVVLGGMGSQLGVVLAAIVLVTLPEFGRAFAEFRMLAFGAAMVAIMVWRPRGLLARRAPSIRLGPADGL